MDRRRLFWLVNVILCCFLVTLEVKGAHGEILKEIRLSRVFMAFAVGGGLAVSGSVLQSLFINPLVSPLTIGVSGASAFGGTLAILLGFHYLGGSGIFFVAFLFSLFTIVLILKFADSAEQVKLETLLLTGLLFNFLYSALIMLFQAVFNYAQLYESVRWLFGSLDIFDFKTSLGVFGLVAGASGIVFSKAMWLNLLSFGQLDAHSMGINVKRATFFFFVMVSCIVALTLSITGPIGFVGLVVPHFSRFHVGPDARRLLPASFLAGATFMLFADWVAHTLLRPVVLPVGVVTSLVGAPYFLWILKSRSSR